jgi:hypothetical protein
LLEQESEHEALASTFFSAAAGFATTSTVAEQEPLEQEPFLLKIPSSDTEETATVVATRNENITILHEKLPGKSWRKIQSGALVTW